MEDMTTKKNIESLVENIFLQRVNHLPLIGLNNFILLRRWARKHGIDDTQMFKGVPNEVAVYCQQKDLTLSKKVLNATISPVKTLVDLLEHHDKYTSNEISARIFDNIQSQYANAGPEIFIQIGQEVVKMNKSFKMLTLFTGNSVSELAYALAALNSRFNRTKSFQITKSKTDWGTEMIRIQVTHKPGLWTPASIANWNFGLQTAGLGYTRDKVIRVNYPINDNSGNWTIEAEYVPSPKGVAAYLFSPMTNALSEVFMKNLELYKRAIESETNPMLLLAEAQLREASTILGDLKSRHPNSAYHSLHQIPLVALTAKQLGFSMDDIEIGVKGTMLHDIGKIGVPDTILHKPGRFEDDELIIMQVHAALGEYSLLEANHDMRVVDIVGNHHASPNSQTNPLVSVVQFWDSFVGLTEERVYRNPAAYSLEKATEILDKDVESGRVHRIIGNVILKETLPMLIQKGYHPHAFDQSLSNTNRENYGKLLSDIQNYIFGKTNEFELKSQVRMNAFIHPTKIKEEAIDDIRDYIIDAYNRIKTCEHKQILKRITPAELRAYLPNDGVPSI